MEGLREAAGRGPEEVRKSLVKVRPLYRSCPVLQGLRLYYLGLWRRSRYQFKSAWVLLSAAADRFSQLGEIYQAGQTLALLSPICLQTGELEQQRRLRQRFLAMLPAVDGTDLIPSERFVSKATRWAEALGIPVVHRGETAMLLLSRRRVHEDLINEFD